MNNFKKTALSLFVIAIFVSYVIYQQRNSNVPVIPPAVSQNSASNTPTPNNAVEPAVNPPTDRVSSENDDSRNQRNVNIVPPAASKPTPPASAQTPAPAPVATAPRGKYKDGTYTGSPADAYYGNIQVQAVIKNGSLVDVVFLDYPQDRGRSIAVNNYAMPILRSEAIQAQSAQVDTVSGATDSSGAFVSSLASALSQAS
jgi:uncharacterized protein with FMN-binding domain